MTQEASIELRNPYSPVIYWLLTLGCLLLPVGGFLLTIPGQLAHIDDWTGVEAVAGGAGLLSLVGGAAMVFFGLVVYGPLRRRAARDYAAFLSGKYLVHWEYDAPHRES